MTKYIQRTLDRTNMDTLYALKKYARKKKRVNLNMPTRKEILKNYGHLAIFHVFKHDSDEVGHFRRGK